jgi:hypothetical protein
MECHITATQAYRLQSRSVTSHCCWTWSYKFRVSDCNNVLIIIITQIYFLQFTALWDVASCSLAEVGRRYRGAYCLCHQDNAGSARVRTVHFTRLHGAASLNTVILTSTAVKTCNLTNVFPGYSVISQYFTFTK